jgi:hypothetical protein
MNPKFHKAKAAAIMTAFVPAFTMANLSINNFTYLLLADLLIVVCTLISCIYECETADILQETEQLKKQKPKIHHETPYSQFLLHHYNYIRYKAFSSKNTTEYMFYRQLGDMLF